jgi:hypothetical protein
MGPARKCHFVSGLPSGSFRILKIGTLVTLGAHTLCEDLRLGWGLEQSCNPHRELSKGMWHVTCTQGNQGDSPLLVVGSQIDNLTPGPSFGHNLCCNYPNGSCKPILDIYVPKDFQRYKELFTLIGFDPWNRSTKIWESIGTPIPKVEAHLGVWRFIPSHSPTFPHSQEHEMWLPRFIFGRTFASPCLGHEPKALVTTIL